MADTPSEDPQQAPDAAGPPAGAPPAEEAAPVKAKEIDRSQVQAIEREVRRSPFLWLTYVLGVALTALLIVGAWYFVRNQEKRIFDFVLRQASAEIERNARSVEAVSYGMQGLFHSVEKVDGDQFRYFSEQAVNRYQFVTETAYYPKILTADREAFEAEATGSSTSPRPKHNWQPPATQNGMSEPSAAAIISRSATLYPSPHRAFRPTSAAAPSLEPPARPAPIGMRFSRWIAAPNSLKPERSRSSLAARSTRLSS